MKIGEKNIDIQEVFYIGYFYLLLIGLISDAIFYRIFGIFYLDYSTILDALISPISLLTNNWKLTLILALMFWIMFMYFNFWMPKLYKKLRGKKWYQKLYNIEKSDERIAKIQNKKNTIPVLMIVFFILFISMKTGMAIGMKFKYDTNGVNANTTLIFKDNSVLKVRKIGQNSAYLFYIIPGEKTITATPIAENIKQIK